jgi:hypothetical protein
MTQSHKTTSPTSRAMLENQAIAALETARFLVDLFKQNIDAAQGAVSIDWSAEQVFADAERLLDDGDFNGSLTHSNDIMTRLQFLTESGRHHGGAVIAGVHAHARRLRGEGKSE